jgi:5-methylcytosine-specific restriction endonuclease McrA
MGSKKNKVCRKCGSKYVANKHFMLCKKCNNERLHGSEYGKKPENYFIKSDKIEKTVEKIKADEDFYEEVFNSSKDHRCENCRKQLNAEFRDDEGRVTCRWRYSHILPKSLYPEYRHSLLNMNNLCLDCHNKWEHLRGEERQKMLIFVKNRENILKLTNNVVDLYRI